MMMNNTTRHSRLVWNPERTFMSATLGSVMILVNLLTIITFTINRHLRKRSTYCVINLTVADMLFGVGGLVTYVFRIQNIDHLWRIGLITFMGAGTMLSLALVAVERMCATARPVRHRNASLRPYALSISITWAAAIMNGLIMAIVMSVAPDNTLFLFLFPGLVMILVVGVICVSYLVIFITVRQQQQQMAGQRVSGPDQRLATTLFMVTVASIGTWIPLALIAILSATDVVARPTRVGSLAIGLALSNSLINPIIYVFRMKDFRKALLRLIFKCSRYQPTQVVPQANVQGLHRQIPVRRVNI